MLAERVRTQICARARTGTETDQTGASAARGANGLNSSLDPSLLVHTRG